MRTSTVPTFLLTASLLLAVGAPTAAASPAPSPAPSIVPDASSPVPSLAASPVPSPAAALDATGVVAWTLLPYSGEQPAAREDHTLVVQPDGAAAWLFGGRSADRTFGDLWRLDLATDTWSRVDAAGDGPSRRFGHAAAWLPDVGMTIFGGQAGATFHDDLWAFDPATSAWTRLPSDGRRPEARYGTCAATGPDGRLWISHGFTADGRFGDTRAWDPATGRWTVETPRSGKAPVERCLHDCLWSPDGRLQLYGGQTNGVPSLGDRWALDPVDGRWTKLAEPDAGARRLYAVAQDAGVAWVFGGLDGRDRPLADLWRWDLVTDAWTPAVLLEESAVPTARSGATLIFDPVRGRALLFGGQGARTELADLWVLGPVDAA